jgi:hypothetical protein
MDEIARRMAEVEFSFAGKDPEALAVLEERIAETGRRLGLITYSDLVKGVVFHLPNVRKGQAYQISIYDWSGMDRAILGEFLGYISIRSYREAGFMASALVVNRDEYMPSDHFFEWMKTLNVLPDTNQDTVLKFWADQVNKAHNWYAAGRK